MICLDFINRVLKINRIIEINKIDLYLLYFYFSLVWRKKLGE